MADTFNLICHSSIIWKGPHSISVSARLVVLKVNAVVLLSFQPCSCMWTHVFVFCKISLIFISCSYIVYNQFSFFSLNRAGFPLCAVHGWYCQHFWAGEFLFLSLFTGCFITGSNKIHAKTRQLCDSLINMAAGVLQVWRSFNPLIITDQNSLLNMKNCAYACKWCNQPYKSCIYRCRYIIFMKIFV